MAYLSLYRKYRPKSFDDVIGQNHIVKTLTNQVCSKNISHAYLFCGTRGTGKTSCAKIFAKSINCLHPVNGSACLNCEVCKAYENANNLDIIEIDAASNNRVDEIRDLREKVNYYPSVGKFKVYIIDEVHMLTDSAFNALLKTLEEPPAHAVFILCTTEVHKLPATILSRCTRFDFRLVSNQDLEQHLIKIFNKEKISYDNESVKLIANAGQGSVRDTLSTAEMCCAFCNGKINYSSALECLGVTDNDTLYEMVESIINKNSAKLLQILNTLVVKGKNLTVVLKDLSRYLNKILTLLIIKENNSEIGIPEEDYNKLKELSTRMNEVSILNMLNKFASIEASLKQSLNPTTLIQVTLLGCIIETNEIEQLKKRVEELEKKTLNNKGAQLKDISNTDGVSFSQVIEQNNNLNAKQVFGEIISKIKSEKLFMLYAVCGDVKQVEIVNNNFVILCANSEQDVLKQNEKLLNDFLKEKYPHLTLQIKLFQDNTVNIEEELKNKFGEKLTIK